MISVIQAGIYMAAMRYDIRRTQGCPKCIESRLRMFEYVFGVHNLFDPTRENIARMDIHSDNSPLYPIGKFTEQHLRIYRNALWLTRHSAPVKCLATNIAAFDATFFEHCNRIEDSSGPTHRPANRSSYFGPSFM